MKVATVVVLVLLVIAGMVLSASAGSVSVFERHHDYVNFNVVNLTKVELEARSGKTLRSTLYGYFNVSSI